MLLAVVFLSFFLFLGWSVYSGILLLYPLLWGLCGVGFVASRRGYSLGEIFCMVINDVKSTGKKRDKLGNIGTKFRLACNFIAESETKKEGICPSFFVFLSAP